MSTLPATGGTATGTSNLAGIACVMAAAAAYTLNDVGIKWLSDDYPLHQITFFRAAIGLLITLAIFVPFEGSYSILRTRRPHWHVLRGLMVIIANMGFFLGIATMPLSEATSIYFVAPLFITAFSVVLLGEHVGWRRWLAIAIGFSGVMLVIRPGASTFQYAALLPLIAAATNALLHISTRKLGVTERASTMAFYIHLVFCIFSLGFGFVFGDGRFAGTGNPSLDFLFRAWVWPSFADAAILVLIGIFGSLGTFLISAGYRISQAGVAAPFEYVSIPLAVLWSILFWGHWPQPFGWAGMLLIAGSGLYIFLRESLQGYAGRWKRPWRRGG